MIAVADRLRPERRRVRARRRFGEAIARERGHRHEVGQIFVIYRLRAETVDHPRGHVVARDEGRVGGGAISNRLPDQRGLEVAERDADRILADVDSSEAARSEEQRSEIQTTMSTTYAVFSMRKK